MYDASRDSWLPSDAWHVWSAELLFGIKTYTPAIDMWSVGCIFAEVRASTFRHLVPGSCSALWFAGCRVYSQLWTREPLMPGKGEFDQITKVHAALDPVISIRLVRWSRMDCFVSVCMQIVDLLGPPNESNMPGFSELPIAKNWKFKASGPSKLRVKFPKMNLRGGAWLTDAGFDLLQRMLCYDHTRRISAKEALDHPWFK